MYRINLLPFLALCFFTRVTLAATVTFNWQFSWITANLDGFSRPVVAVNGQFPLPTVNVTLGDQVVINAINNLGNSSMTLHFHGIYQNGTNTEDGPFQVTQCGIPPGQSLTYSFPVSEL
jgi:iron transport multicopper oxidase